MLLILSRLLPVPRRYESVKRVWGDIMLSYTERYRAYCSDLNAGAGKSNIKRHNIAMGKLERLYRAVQKEADKTFLLELINDENEWVRLIASTDCLRMNVYIREAVNVLEVLSIHSTIIDVRLDSSQVLHIWRKQGYI